MSSDVTLKAIAGFRLVSAAPELLTIFYQAIGFTAGEIAPIPAAEMAALGLPGAGWRRSLTLGESLLDLDSFDLPGFPYPDCTSASDLVFQHLALVTDDAHAAWPCLRNAGATPITRGEPVRLPQSSGGVTAIKFRDPEGHPLELLEFPVGSNPSWRGRGMMGIDHSAISITDLTASRRFYEEHGLTAGQRTRNWGPTQVALDSLDGAEVDVLPMNPPDKPPHVELLGYRQPAGRPHPPLAANDVAATRIVWSANCDALVRDPDGHLLQLTRQDRPPANIASQR
jgi:catechol 2,3-dioxygenase-like lactoylglutathione lyase family enzyme